MDIQEDDIVYWSLDSSLGGKTQCRGRVLEVDATREDEGGKYNGLVVVDCPSDPNEETWIRTEDIDEVEHTE